MLSDLKKRLIYNTEKTLRRLPVKKKKICILRKNQSETYVFVKRDECLQNTHISFDKYIYIFVKRDVGT